MISYTIGQVSKKVGLPTKTIRFYEESGILSSVSRSENGYRNYSAEVVEELQLLKYARDLGLPLSEIKKLMKGCEDGDCGHSKDYIEKTIDNYLLLLTKKIRQLTVLKSKMQLLRGSLPTQKDCKSDVFCCDILHQLVDYAKRKGGEKNGRML